ncbi:hypothetical protein SAMN02745857_02698 [Andreprevotia lacus DSM 23236]|jgi:hypothetical protein|uniref:Uncharacterized protein n=1 Tax=Andreprevotia lacus DSM 23236 TaxID=1121001 RepID=A0A1W1XT93_9NEIS|nr:hypothetical protein SAMN02745857_02698 [Andreprevotia lacus DSM 23236]
MDRLKLLRIVVFLAAWACAYFAYTMRSAGLAGGACVLGVIWWRLLGDDQAHEADLLDIDVGGPDGGFGDGD